ncbi:MAG TPA: peptidoglycan recognition protein [Acidimicrobiales bacterium]|nr:peptidoglycan recognition protein [Acidimicrobiales bacterium]
MVVVGAVVLSAASAVVPVSMAWGGPATRLASLAAPPAPTLSVPFARAPLGVGRSLALPFPVSHLGVRWKGSDSAVVEVRTAERAGQWGPWRVAEVAHDLGDEAHRVVLSGLVRAGGARFAQVRARGDAAGVEVVAIDTEHGRRRLVRAAAPPARADVADPPVITRAQWGADESIRRHAPSFAPVTRMVVHHTVTPNDDPDPAATMRAIEAYHVKANGWDDIGYNFVVDAAGRVYEGRWARNYGPGETHDGESLDGQGVVGAHAEGENAGSVGVALLGEFTGRDPSPAALDALQRLLAWKAERNGIDPLGTTTWAGGQVLPTIVGHRDVGQTTCPGDRLQSRLGAVRQAVGAVVARDRASVPPAYVVLGRDGTVVALGTADPGLVGGLGPALLAPGAAIAATPSGRGWWALTGNGRVLPSGDAPLLGSPELSALLGPVGRTVAIEPTPSGLGYWVAGEDGRVWNFGDAPNLGSAPAGPVVGMARTTSGRGYWLATGSGRVMAFGDAPYLGDAPGRSIVAVAGAAGGRGYWLVGSDGSVYPFGTARRAGGLPQRGIADRVVAARPSHLGHGYYLLGAGGAVYAFGDAVSYGTAAGRVGTGAAGLGVP